MTTLSVLHIDTERGWRGGERQAFWLARELAARGHRSVLAVRPNEPLARACRDADVSILACEPRASLDPLAALALRRWIRRERTDVVHAHTSHGATLGALATMATDVPLVVSRRVDFPLGSGVGSRWKYGRARRVIAVSNAVARVVEQSGVPHQRIVVIHDGVDLTRTVVPADPAALRACGVSPGHPLVVQVSALVGHKDPLTFVRAMRVVVDDVPDAQGLLVGAGPLHASVLGEIESLGLSGNVHAPGFRSDADALLAAADVVTLSSLEEGLGSVLLDALVFGKPVAATAAGGIPEIVVDGTTGLLSPPGDAIGLGRSIIALLADPGRRAAMGRAARARAERFSVSRMTDETLAVYGRLSSRT